MAPTAAAAAPALSGRQILRFYTPLVLTSVLMTLSGPMLNVAIGRGAEPRLDLAAFWIGFTVVLFVESASLATQQVTIALAGAGGSLLRLIVAALAAGTASSLLVLAVALTPLGELVFRHLIHTTARAADQARSVLAHLSPMPVLVCIRGIGSGVAIAERRTRLVALGTMVRVLVLSLIAGAAVMTGTGAGAVAAAWALLAGTAIETALVAGATFPSWRARLLGGARPGLSYREILRVAAPLAVATLIWTSVRPAVNAVLGRLPDAELAQAGFGVVLPILFVTCSPLWALQEVGLVLPRTREDLRRVVRFAGGAAGAIALALVLLTATPLGVLVLRLGFDLPPELESAVAPALALITLEPLFLAARALAQGLLVKARRTAALLVLSPAKIVLLVAAGLGVVAWHPQVNGAALALWLVMGGDLFDALVFGWKARGAVRDGSVFGRVPDRASAALARPHGGNDA